MYKASGILLTSLMFGATALAGPGGTSIVVDNRFDGKADVFIDGYFSGQIQGDTKTKFTTRPGMSEVLVLRDGGAVLLNEQINASRGQSTLVRVVPPQGSLFVRNTGRAPLLVTADASSAWVTPGKGMNLTVTTGRVALVSKTQDRFGKTTVVNRQTVWVEPGRKADATVKYEPAARTGVLIKNRDHHVVRVHVGNRDYGMLQPGAEIFASAAPGSIWVTVNRPGGVVRFNGSVAIRKGADSKVVVDDYGSGQVYSSNGSKYKTYTYDGWSGPRYAGMSTYSPSWKW